MLKEELNMLCDVCRSIIVSSLPTSLRSQWEDEPTIILLRGTRLAGANTYWNLATSNQTILPNR